MNRWYFIYVLLSRRGWLFYIGFSANVFSRTQQHNAGLNISTARRRPLELIYYEAHRSRDDALRREHYFKTTKGKVTLRSIIRSFLISINYFSHLGKSGPAVYKRQRAVHGPAVYPSAASGSRQGSSAVEQRTHKP